MKKLDEFLGQLNCTYSADRFKIKGRLVHWSTLFFPGGWILYGFILLAEGEFVIWILSGLIALGISALIVLAFWFEIEFGKDKVVVKLLFGFIPYKTIESATNDLIIDHRDAEQLTLISQRKDYYSEDVKNNLRFSYITPWDGDKEVFYVDYLDKEVELESYFDDRVWVKLIDGIKTLEKIQATKDKQL